MQLSLFVVTSKQVFWDISQVRKESDVYAAPWEYMQSQGHSSVL